MKNPDIRCKEASGSPLVSFTNCFTDQRPHYIFNVTIKPPTIEELKKESEPNAVKPKCKVDYSHCIKAVPRVPKNGVVSVCINTYFVHKSNSLNVTTKELFIMKQAYDAVNYCKEFRKDSNQKQLCALIDKLQTVNLIEFRSEGIIDDDEVINKFCELCESNLAIRDIELNLEHLLHVKQILYSLRKNYVIKTVRLLTEQRIKEKSGISLKRGSKDLSEIDKLQIEILEYCEEFRSKRIGTEIMLNTTHKRFRYSDKKGFELYYK
ncbi:unnamed protein product [Moneuplotes crassus]|uniref:Uncharacterized protein n=1 Tax=Euplotes crassus TaxID=5936 RepID=A0AAD1XSX2_EUPCR|nr:unnamed protein product [Moneuplotes crassus]